MVWGSKQAAAYNFSLKWAALIFGFWTRDSQTWNQTHAESCHPWRTILNRAKTSRPCLACRRTTETAAVAKSRATNHTAGSCSSVDRRTVWWIFCVCQVYGGTLHVWSYKQFALNVRSCWMNQNWQQSPAVNWIQSPRWSQSKRDPSDAKLPDRRHDMQGTEGLIYNRLAQN